MSSQFVNKFAFFVHPRVSAIEDMGKVFAPIAWIGKILKGRARDWFENFLRKVSSRLGPMPFPCYLKGERKPIGWIIVIPFMGECLVGNLSLVRKHRDEVLQCMENGVRLAAKLGAKIIGLGALTAPATHGGKDLLSVANECGVFITNGNSLTGGVTAQTAIEMAETAGMAETDTISILGAVGSVGRAVSEILVLKNRKLLCIDTNVPKLTEFYKTMSAIGFESQIEISSNSLDVGKNKLSILVTSAARELFDNSSQVFSPGSWILDDTQPRAMKRQPEKTIVVDGGVLFTPTITYKIDIGLSPHLAYACLGETILMAHDGRLEHHIGDCSADRAMIEMKSFYANSDIIRLAPLRSFGKEIKLDNLVV